ncbi:MAG: 16S rRNA (guanine(527)-N(7))-methyltransferase RsmG [Albidovulum sp.]
MKGGQTPFGDRNVSRETLERLADFEQLLKKWNPAINLVARSTLGDIWGRHFLDSVQVFDMAPKDACSWADIGSGGGFPGLVAAVLAADERPEMRVVLVESDKRKAAFLSSCSRQLNLTTTVMAERAESLEPLGVDVLSARALAPLDGLAALAERHLGADGVALFPKGANHQCELNQALENWAFTYHKEPSKTDPHSVILSIRGVTRV